VASLFAEASRVFLELKASDQTSMTGDGTGGDSVLKSGASGWKDGTDGPANTGGLVVTFSGLGENVTVQAGDSSEALLFDTFSFTADGYTLSGDALAISPSASQEEAGTINVTDSARATIENKITGTGMVLKKEGEGTLELTGINDYDGGTFVNAGTLIGDSQSLQGDIKNEATLVFNQPIDGEYSGHLTGEGTVVKEGDGTLTLTGKNELNGDTVVKAGEVVALADLALGQGSYHLNEGTSLSIGNTDQQIGGLSGSGSLSIGQGTLEIHVKNEREDVFDGDISGYGNILKDGYGSLVLNDNDALINDLDVYSGSLIIGGDSDNSSAKLYLSEGETLDVHNGAILGGFGTIASNISIREGAALSPGNSYGFQTTDGDLTFESGSYFIVEVDPLDVSGGDRAIVTGLATLAGTVQHLSNLNYDVYDYAQPNKEWLILDAGSLSGVFDGIESDLSFLVPKLRYDSAAANVYLSFGISTVETDVSMEGNTYNQKMVLKAIQSLPYDTSLFSDIVNNTTNSNIDDVLDGLSGEIYASLPSALQSLSFVASRDVLRHVSEIFRTYESKTPVSAGESVSHNVWINMGDAYNVFRATDNSEKTVFKGFEISGGYDFSLSEGFVGGLALFFADKNLKTKARGSEIDVNSFGISAYVGKSTNLSGKNMRFIFGGGIAGHDLDGERKIPLGAAYQTLKSSTHATSWQIFLDASLALPIDSRSILEPFLTIGWSGLKIDGFAETGGNAALNSDAKSVDNSYTQLGLRFSSTFSEKFAINGELSWRHVYGRLEHENIVSFREGGDRFSVSGASGNRDAANLGLTGSIRLSDSVNLNINYDGSYGSGSMSHTGSATLAVKW
jgi:autotransporter-associated beta strand protein